MIKRNMKRLLILSIVLLSFSSIFSQNVSKPFYQLTYFSDSLMSYNDFGGNVEISENPRLEQLITNFSIAYKSQHQRIWRVQIYFGSGRNGRVRAQNIKGNFESKHAGIPTSLIFQEPYFKVRVGEFSSKLDAERLKAQLIEEYDKIFIVEDYEK